MSGRPISPSEIVLNAADGIPSGVFDVVNELVQNRVRVGNKAKLLRKDVENALREAGFSEVVPQVFRVLDAYRNMGWDVKYMAPDYTESWAAYWEFSPAEASHRVAPNAVPAAYFCAVCGRQVEYVSPRWQHVGGSISLDESHSAAPRM